MRVIAMRERAPPSASSRLLGHCHRKGACRKPPQAEVAGRLTNVRFGGAPTALPATGLGRERNASSGWEAKASHSPLSRRSASDPTRSFTRGRAVPESGRMFCRCSGNDTPVSTVQRPFASQRERACPALQHPQPTRFLAPGMATGRRSARYRAAVIGWSQLRRRSTCSKDKHGAVSARTCRHRAYQRGRTAAERPKVLPAWVVRRCRPTRDAENIVIADRSRGPMCSYS